MNKTLKTANDRIVYLIQQTELSIDEVSAKSGVSNSLLYKITSDNADVSDKSAKKITEAFSITPENWIMQGGALESFEKNDKSIRKELEELKKDYRTLQNNFNDLFEMYKKEIAKK